MRSRFALLALGLLPLVVTLEGCAMEQRPAVRPIVPVEARVSEAAESDRGGVQAAAVLPPVSVAAAEPVVVMEMPLEPALPVTPPVTEVPPSSVAEPAAEAAPSRPSVASSALTLNVPTLPARPALRTRPLTGSAEVPRIDCRTPLSKEDDLTRSVVEERLREGSYYAALAQVQALPAKIASVAIMRADILRRLRAPEAEAWYRALQDTCMAAQAEHGLGLLSADQQDYALARKHLMAAAEQQPANARIRNDLGYIYLFLGQDRQAEFELRTAHELAPDDRQPALNLALLALLRGDTADWWRWRERLKSEMPERSALERSCRQLSLQWATLRAKAEGRAVPTMTACPIDPTR